MSLITQNLLFLILFTPAIAAALMLFLPNGENRLSRWFAFGASLHSFTHLISRAKPEGMRP